MARPSSSSSPRASQPRVEAICFEVLPTPLPMSSAVSLSVIPSSFATSSVAPVRIRPYCAVPLAVRFHRSGAVARSYAGPLLDLLEAIHHIVLGGLEAGVIFGDAQRRAVVSAPAPPAALRVLLH